MQNMSITSRSFYIMPLVITHMNFWSHDLLLGSFIVICGQRRTLSITCDIKEMCGWSQCVSVIETRRLICDMTSLGNQVASHDLNPSLDFELSPSQSTCAYIFRRVWMKETPWNLNRSPSFLFVQMLFAKSRFGKERPLWPSCYVCTLNCWRYLKISHTEWNICSIGMSLFFWISS